MKSAKTTKQISKTATAFVPNSMTAAELTKICKEKLLTQKQSLMNQLRTIQNDFNMIDKSRGDESDLSFAHQEEHQFLITQGRIKRQMIDIENALARIENATFGYCEMTGERIEESRLMALPWTRFSVEGAEIFESQNQRSTV